MKDFDRWFHTDDTPQWKRAAFRFLVAVSIALMAALLLWWLLGR